MDEELLQDFLVEAGEILEQLNEQLVDLENSPDDMEMLNAVFRGFHTIKGGAGFLEIHQMVEICHRAEDVFNLLRNGDRHVDANLMDTVLPVLDVLNAQFDSLRSGDEPPHAEQDLLAGLDQIIKGEAVAEAPAAAPPTESPPASVTEDPSPAVTPDTTGQTAEPASDEITDEEFDKLLDDIHGEGQFNPAGASQPAPAPATSTDSTQPTTQVKSDPGIPDNTIVGGGENITDEEFELLLNALQNPEGAQIPATEAVAKPSGPISDEDITDEEFEQILDNLHGEGQFNPATTSPATPASAPAVSSTPASDEISEEEFDKLLDTIHGEGQFNPAVSNASEPPAAGSLSAAPVISSAPASDEISEEEFDKLLDNIHGEGQFNPAATQSAVTPQTSNENETPAVSTASQVAAPATTVATPPAAEQSKPEATPATPAKPTATAAKEKSAPQAETTVRVDTKRLDDIMNMVGELVLVRNRIDRLGSTIGDEEMIKAVANLDLVTTDLQMSVMKTRMQPIKKVFGRFPRVVRDIARNLKKEIKLEMEGEDTDLDKNLVDALADPLVHLVRNAVDHGIEMPDEREAAGKPREGRVLLKAEQEGDHILLSIEDDGKGMDPNRLREIAVEKGMMDADAAARLDDHDVYNLIFAPGFSTKQEISDISGRGVGMDVVKTRIAQLNGTVEIDSELGKGSKLSIKLPLTLAIMPTLMVQLDQQLFALPLVSVNEIFHLDLTKTNVVDNQLCVVVRGRTLPLFYLSRWLVKGQRNAELPTEGHVVVVHVGNQKVGFVVDELIGQEEVVIKPLGEMLQGTEGLAGATITGDGGIAIILDVPGLIQQYARHAA
ncbi:MAG: chemotaxis protein CheA [Gammaproteobacteria bacterium]|nr:chemotaxis protein CheA [Gammaproteobacteria bacterium]